MLLLKMLPPSQKNDPPRKTLPRHIPPSPTLLPFINFLIPLFIILSPPFNVSSPPFIRKSLIKYKKLLTPLIHYSIN
jgi:hypothetical protein